MSMSANQTVPASNVVQTQSKGMAITGFVLSLVGLVLFGFILGVLAIIFSAIALKRVNEDPQNFGGKGLATAGLIIGIIDIVFGFLWGWWMFSNYY